MATLDAQHVPAALPAGRYGIDPGGSSIRFRTRHLFGLGAVSGKMAISSGEIVVTDPPASSTVSATVDAATFDTSNARRDRDVRSARFLHVDEHPTMSFAASAPVSRDGHWVIPGQLTVRQTTRPIELTVHSLGMTAGKVRARATTRVDRYAFGIAGAKGMAARHLDVDVDLELVAAPQ